MPHATRQQSPMPSLPGRLRGHGTRLRHLPIGPSALGGVSAAHALRCLVRRISGWVWDSGEVATVTVDECYDLFPFLLIYFLFCLSLCAVPCLAPFAFLCACFIAYLCVVLGHILHDT